MLWQGNLYEHMDTTHTGFCCCPVALQVLYIFTNGNVMQELTDITIRKPTMQHKQHWIAFLSDKSTKFNSELQRGHALAAQNINVAMWYVETKDRAVIDGDRATDIHCFARTVWLSIAKNKSLPATWGQADIDVRRQYCNEWVLVFPNSDCVISIGKLSKSQLTIIHLGLTTGPPNMALVWTRKIKTV